MSGAENRARLHVVADPGGRKAGSIDVEIGQRIRRLRNGEHLSQEELAARLGISCQQLQKYESGANRISASRLVQLADSLRVDISLFLRADLDGGGAAVARGSTEAGDRAEPGSKEMLTLMTSFAGIGNPASRAKIIEMALFLAGLEAGAPKR